MERMVEAEMVNGDKEPEAENEIGGENCSSTSGREDLRATGQRVPGLRSGSIAGRPGAWGKLNTVGILAGLQKEARGDSHGVPEEVDWAAGISWEVIAQEFDGLNVVDALASNSEDEVRVIDLDVDKAAARLGRLRKAAIVLQILETNPSRDRVVSWAHDTMERRLGVRINQVTALSRREFLVVFESTEDRKVVLSRPPGFLDGKAVRMVEWEKRNLIKLAVNMKVAWVELRDLPPFLEDQVGGLLEAIGPVVSHSLERQVGLSAASIDERVDPERGTEEQLTGAVKESVCSSLEISDDNLGNIEPVEGQELEVQGSVRPMGLDCLRNAGGNQQFVGEVNSGEDEKVESSLVKSSNKGGMVRNLRAKQNTVFKSAGGKKALVGLESASSRDPDSRRLSGIKALARKGRAPRKKVLPDRSLDWLDAPFVGDVEETMRGGGGDSLKECRQVLGELEPNRGEAEQSGSERDVSSEDNIGRKWGEEGLKQDDHLSLVSWNVRGLSRTSKAAGVKKWLRFNKGGVKAIRLQEVKWNGWGMQRWLKSIFKDGTVIFDQPRRSKGGTALILHGSLYVLETGVGGDGRIAWAKVQNGDSWFGILSVYAPNKRKVRIEFWEKIKWMIRVGEWVILGDFNQVDLLEDAVGRSTLVCGREKRWWHQFLVKKGLVDSFICAARRMGGRYIRVARKAGRLEALRLDRFYFTSGAGWFCHVREVKHHGSSRLSDHCPISVVIQMSSEEGIRKRESYFKMNFYDLQDPEVLKEVRSEKSEQRKRDEGLPQEIGWRRKLLSAESSPEEVEALAKAEGRLKNLEIQKTREWKIRSHDKWIAEDAAPAQYFFVKLRAKWAREAIQALENLDGEVVTKNEGILDLIHLFYQSLFSAEPESVEKARARGEVVGLLDRELSEMDRNRMSAIPDRDEIEKVVFGMARYKAPGQDGLTMEVVKECWKFVGEECVMMVFIDLVKGFTCGSTARVHVNCRFTPEINLERGVRQGCPLAPLLFALCTQPFMKMLRRAESMGRVSGLEIEPGRSLLHQLFADDTGVCIGQQKANFDELLKILEEYELASGAKVNIAKSLVMPLGSKEVPTWVDELGCEVAGSGRAFRYLGVQIGVDLLGNESITTALRKLNSRFLQWEDFYLPWAARVILIKHILAQIPSFVMMAVGCSVKDAKRLEQCCRQFLWGVNEQGTLKKPLIAWGKIAQPKDQGGLGLMGFKDRSDALQMRYMTAILDGRNVEWIWIAKRMMRIKLLTRPCKQERKLWTSEMALLLLSSWKFEEAPTVDRLLKVWFRFRKFLRFSDESTVVPANLPIVSLKKWWMLTGEECPDTFATIEECAKKLGAVKMGDVSKEEWGREIGVIRTGEARVGKVEAGAFVLRWLLQAQIIDRPLQQVIGWFGSQMY
ncbi:hypothetical protein R1flu_008847 [Riccia fluitans]|uniref:Reverse transcriptase domain-containing protein n=1 Tax=Riccia fluitans TaxID=41844 RepID=A0ABD1Z0M4_9MARC